MTITELIVCIVAGLGAGLGTGLAGLSAAAVVSPMLITFLHMPAYQAIGIALASDVLASGVSAWTYKKNKNIDIRHGVIMLISVLIFTLVGSFVSSLVPNGTMGGFSKGMTLLVGLKFMIRPIMTTKRSTGKQIRGTENPAVHSLRCVNWLYLRFCRCRRRYDAASGAYKCAWL